MHQGRLDEAVLQRGGNLTATELLCFLPSPPPADPLHPSPSSPQDILMWVDQDNWVNDMAVDVLDEDAKEV